MRRIPTALATFAGAAALIAAGLTAPAHAEGGHAPDPDWRLADRIAKKVKPPKFPNRDFRLTDYGADPTGEKASTDAFADAIADASERGGRVVVPEGDYLTGPIHLKSDVDLHVSDGADVHFSQDPQDYLPGVLTRFEGVELYNYSPFIYANGAENVAITGGGTLDGQADEDHWWPWKEESDGEGGVIETEDRDDLFEMAEDGVPVEDRDFGADSKLRPNFMQFYDSQDIMVSDVTLTNSPMWMIHPVLSENVTVDGVNLDSPNGPNSDGVDPESSRNVVIKNSTFDNGDDCIAIKSGRNADGRRIDEPSENIVMFDNEMADGHGGVTIGSEMTGGVRNVFAEDNTMDSSELLRALRIKTNSVRGGTVEHVYFRNNTIRRIADEVVRFNFQYEEGDAGDHTPVVRDINIEDVQSDGGAYALYMRGYERSPISDVTIRDSAFDGVEEPMLLEHVSDLDLRNTTINGASYDETIDRGAL